MGLSLFSGFLLILSFPKTSAACLAWLALAPLCLVLRSAPSLRDAVKYAGVTSLLFYGGSLFWLNHVAFVGWVFVACLETFFFLLFGVSAAGFSRQGNAFLRVAGISFAWTFSECLRAEIPVFGFGWNLLAYSQAGYPPMIQFANLLGAYGLGWIMAAVNALLAEAVWAISRPKGKGSTFIMAGGWVLSALLILFGLLSYGRWELSKSSLSRNPALRVSVIQGNIPQSVKWEPVAKDKILEIYLSLTKLAGFDAPHLIVWPEAAFPGYFNRDVRSSEIGQLTASLGIPVLVGSPHYEDYETAYNSAYLLGPDGQIKGRYDKLRLVPFGEYVPLKPVLGWLEPLAYTLGVSNFSAGKEFNVFDLQNGELSFSVLICFEDIFPVLARTFVRRGADFLAVITNDAWFGPTGAPYQHLQASVFRAVENGVPIVRAANTGVSAFISATGKVLGGVRDEKGRDLFVIGRKTLPVPLEKRDTFYGRGGWLFPYAVIFIFFGMILNLRFRGKGRGKQDKGIAVFPVFLFGISFLLLVAFSGCIRVQAGATTWHRDSPEEPATVQQYVLDSRDLLPQNRPRGSITQADD